MHPGGAAAIAAAFAGPASGAIGATRSISAAGSHGHTASAVAIAHAVGPHPRRRRTSQRPSAHTPNTHATAARLCALNVIAQLQQACAGDLDRVRRCVKVTGFVNTVPGFSQHPEVINGASDTIVQIFGDIGKHARAAVGAGSLPRNVAVEVEAIFEIA